MTTATEHHTYNSSEPLTPAELAEWEASGWSLYSVVGPVSADDRQRGYHFRRLSRASRADGERASEVMHPEKA